MVSVSIIIPIYNVESFVAECLQSVAIQNYEGPIECILVDDCGTDKSIEITKSYIDNYKGDISFHLIHHNKNSGLSAARNTGINAAKGDYIYFLDSDDVITPDCISTLAKLAVGKEDVVCGAYKTFEGYLYYWSDIYHLIDFSSTDHNEILHFYTSGSLHPMATNKMIRRKLILDNHLFFKEGIIHEDELWSFLVANRAVSMKTTQHITYNYRVRGGSIMCSNSKWKSHESHVKIIHEMKRLLKNGELQPINDNYSFIRKKEVEWWYSAIEDNNLSIYKKAILLTKYTRTIKDLFFLKSWIKYFFKRSFK